MIISSLFKLAMHVFSTVTASILPMVPIGCNGILDLQMKFGSSGTTCSLACGEGTLKLPLEEVLVPQLDGEVYHGINMLTWSDKRSRHTNEVLFLMGD
ncbi:hypothetical protein CC80DRAFT_5513 [Byssothecium circinans]|uniref:Uncharacterized protein n=1 Tax=Byssothecium circinans TaxID=147558 RepID=A0A6A5UQS0_9PLEO|nr:hypothetical protein CC80DRAFT_5513 [Byssothecium circinans]